MVKNDVEDDPSIAPGVHRHYGWAAVGILYDICFSMSIVPKTPGAPPHKFDEVIFSLLYPPVPGAPGETAGLHS